MKNIIFLIILFPLTIFSQTQIGDDLIGEFEGDLFGSSVALSEDGTFLVIGSISNSETGVGAGQAQVFENVNGSWVQLGQDINGDEADAKLGRGVAISDDGTIIALGADGDNDGMGSVRVFELVNESWVQIGDELVGNNQNGLFGNEVALSADGTILAVGAPGSFGFSGSAHIFQNQGGTWEQLGDDINNDVTNTLFGNGLDISADGLTIAIGADGFSAAPGDLRVFEFVANNWTQIGQTLIGEQSFDRLGSNVSISDDGTIVLVSALGNEANGISTGAVRVYENIAGTWIKIGSDVIGINGGGQFGASVTMSGSGNVIGVGSFVAENERIFQNIDDNWVEIATIDGELDSFFGLQSNISNDGLSIAIGAQSFDGNGFNRGIARVFSIEDEIILSVDQVQENDFVLFPNPTSGILRVQIENDDQLQEVFVYNNLGQKLLSFTEAVMDLSSLSSGVYYVEVVSVKGRSMKNLILD